MQLLPGALLYMPATHGTQVACAVVVTLRPHMSTETLRARVLPTSLYSNPGEHVVDERYVTDNTRLASVLRDVNAMFKD